MFGLPSLYLWLGGVALAAIVAGAGVGWTVHKVDAASYEALQLADANALNVQLTKDQAAAQAFNARAATAMEATSAKLKTLAAQRAAKASQLTQVFQMEGMNNAPLAACLAMPLPADVLQQLTH